MAHRNRFIDVESQMRSRNLDTVRGEEMGRSWWCLHHHLHDSGGEQIFFHTFSKLVSQIGQLLPQKAPKDIPKTEKTTHVLFQDDVAMLLRLEDELREDALGAVRSLQGVGVYVAMLTGDERKAAEAVAHALGIQERPNGLERLKTGEKQEGSNLDDLNMFDGMIIN